ncbi:MAG: caspase family protein, partial [Cyanobacteria bacterium J06648_16]
MPRYALLVGTGQYDSPELNPLSKPEGDAQAMRELLRQGDYIEPLLLLNPTQKQLIAGLETLFKQARRSDALIYFTGHGFIAGESDEEEEAYLATRDCRVEWEDTRIVAPRRALSFKRLNKLIAKAELSSLVMLLDCCHGGYFLKKRLVRSELGVFQERSYCLMAACGAFERAYAEWDEPHSLFTGAVVAALQADADRVTVPDLSKVITTRLRDLGQAPVFLWAGNDITVLERRRAAADPATSEENPYQGLAAFTVKTRQFFFGREAEVAQLTRQLGEVNFVPVIGASGSGKSSVVRAGLVDRMVRQGWQVLGPIKPGPKPLDRLQGAFDGLFNNREIGEIYQLIESDGLTAVLPRLPVGRYLLVIDQFEEVFTVCASQEKQKQFVSCLTGISQTAGSPLKIVTTMRSDFVTPWLSSDALTRVIQNDAVWLGTLQGEALTTAIVEPARKQGYTVERELLALIESDVAEEENCLPLLEFALTQLWDQRDTETRKLTAAAYRSMGQLRGALNQRAEQIYNEDGSDPKGFKTELERDWCRRVCLELVRIGPEGTDTRSRQRRQDVLDKSQSEKEKEIINNVIETLVEGRLLVADKAEESAAVKNDLTPTDAGDPPQPPLARGVTQPGGSTRADQTQTANIASTEETIDIAHEALMNGWERFKDWREADRDRLRLLQRMKDSYEEWQGKQQDNNYLLQKGLLAEVRERWAELKADVTGGLYNYFSRSDEQEKADVAVLEKALAEAELREARTKILNLPPVKAVDKTLLAVKAVGESLEKLQNEVINPVQYALNHAWRKVCERLRLEGHTDSVSAVAFSPSGDRIVSGSHDQTLRLWDLEGNQIGAPFEGHTDSVRAVAFSP